MTLAKQDVSGDILVDEVSTLNLYLKDNSSYTGAVNEDGQEGEVYVEIEAGSVWTLTGDSYITSLTCDASSIDLNGYKLYVNGEEYEAGTASSGEAVEVTVVPSGNGGPEMPGEMPPGGMPPEGGHGPGNGQEPPEKPDGKEPPEKPEDRKNS